MTLIAKYTSKPYVYILGGLLADIFTNVHYNPIDTFHEKSHFQFQHANPWIMIQVLGLDI